MSRLTESAIEDFAIKLFERLGYSAIYAPDIAPDGEYPEPGHYAEGLLAGLGKVKLQINWGLDVDILAKLFNCTTREI